VLGLRDQRVDQRLGFVDHALAGGRPDDHVAHVLAGERPQEVQPARHLVAELGQHREPRQEVRARGRQHAQRRRAHRERGDRGRDRTRLGGLRQGQQLLELIDEHQQAARRTAARCLVARDGLAERAGHGVGLVAQRSGERVFVAAGPRRERRRERLDGMSPRHDLDARPSAVLRQPRQHAGAAQRRLAGPGIAADHDERLDPHAIDELANLAGAAEELRRVHRLEHREPAVGIAVRIAVRRGRLRAELERGVQRVGRREPRARIALDQAIDDRCERRFDRRRDVAEPRDVDLLHGIGELFDLDVAKRRGAGEQLVEQDAERVEVRAPRRWLAAPDLGCHVHRRADDL
jgi:hypothetical protein